MGTTKLLGDMSVGPREIYEREPKPLSTGAPPGDQLRAMADRVKKKIFGLRAASRTLRGSQILILGMLKKNRFRRNFDFWGHKLGEYFF